MAKHGKRESAEYLGLLFQPVPYSVTTPHGMPREFEKYYKNPDFAICNVPPQFMFKGTLLSAIDYRVLVYDFSNVGVQRNATNRRDFARYIS